MHKDELSNGALKYKMGLSYKECKNPKELNEWTTEERLSKCGYLDKHWNKTSNIRGNQLRLRVPENNEDVFVFVGEKVKK